jgi:hypothetical protein
VTTNGSPTFISDPVTNPCGGSPTPTPTPTPTLSKLLLLEDY